MTRRLYLDWRGLLLWNAPATRKPRPDWFTAAEGTRLCLASLVAAAEAAAARDDVAEVALHVSLDHPAAGGQVDAVAAWLAAAAPSVTASVGVTRLGHINAWKAAIQRCLAAVEAGATSAWNWEDDHLLEPAGRAAALLLEAPAVQQCLPEGTAPPLLSLYDHPDKYLLKGKRRRVGAQELKGAATPKTLLSGGGLLLGATRHWRTASSTVGSWGGSAEAIRLWVPRVLALVEGGKLCGTIDYALWCRLAKDFPTDAPRLLTAVPGGAHHVEAAMLSPVTDIAAAVTAARATLEAADAAAPPPATSS